MKSINAGCQFNPVKNRYGSERKGITLEFEPVSLYLVLNCFITVRYYFCVLQYRYLFFYTVF
jgi:hypothetical protein